MKSKRNIVLVLVGAMMAVTVTASAHNATNLNWISKTCLIIDGTFQVCKPSPTWDTQQKDIREEAVRWVLHRRGPNPIIKLIYDTHARGKTAHVYAKEVAKDLEVRGLHVTNTENKVINGRNVSLLYASGDADKLDYLVAVYRDQDKGLKLECTAAKDNFSFFAQEFRAAIDSVKFVR